MFEKQTLLLKLKAVSFVNVPTYLPFKNTIIYRWDKADTLHLKGEVACMQTSRISLLHLENITYPCEARKYEMSAHRLWGKPCENKNFNFK